MALLLRKSLLAIIAAMASAAPILAQTGIPAGSMSQCDAQMQGFLNNYQIPGATYAITKNGKLVYMRAFGTADRAGAEPTQPYHLFRIASLSKPITSIAIMKLIENGQLSLNDKPFGPGGILNDDPYFANANVTDSRVHNITIRNLLEHSAGWNREVPMSPNPLPPYPWGYGFSDPIDFPLHVTQTLGEPNPVSRRSMIKFLLQRGLDFTPGTAYKYSNIGFLVLGEVIEKKTGMTYESYIKQQIFAPLGIYDLHLGKNLLEHKLEREGEYITKPTFTSLSLYGTGQMVPLEYGGVSVEAMDAHGGWIATARDLLRLLTAVDGFPSRPDILAPGTLQTMSAPSVNNSNYAKGWEVNAQGHWWHTGALHGSASIMVRTNSQYTWAILLNSRTQASGFWTALDGLGWSCVNSTTTFPAHDLFDVPTQNASAMNFSNVTSDSITVDWTNGNGDGRVLIMRAGGAPNRFPLDGTQYAPNPQVDLGAGNYVVYSGTGNSATVSGLNSATNYQFRLYEYRKSANTGNYALYQLGNSASGSRSTAGTPARPAQLLNISTRTAVQSGDNVLIGGFIINGSDSKKVIVRAIGPSLPVDGRLANPQLELFDSTGALVRANDNWQEAANRQEIIDSTLAPSADLESAVLLTLAPGAYTAVVRGVDGGVGVSLVELYDLDPTAASKLANISTRGSVQTGDNVMIAGTIVAGVESQKVLVRALGPSLPVGGSLGDPSLELFDGNGVLLAANNNWQDTQRAEIEATTIPPPNDLEAAIVTGLPPAAYTAVVRGVGDSSGVALVEVYALE